MLSIKERTHITKVLGDKVSSIRDDSLSSTDDRYLKLVNLFQESNGKVSQDEWEQVLSDNDYFHIQNSHDFSEQIEDDVKNGADKKYLRYVDYVKKLGTKYFAPAFTGGMHGALLDMCQSIIIYLYNGNKIFNKTKAEYKEQLKTMFHCYQKKQTKQGAWGDNSQFSIDPEQMEEDIEHPKNFDDLLDVLAFYKTHVVHLCNLLNDWIDVHYCLSSLSHKYDDKAIKFSRNGVLNTYANGYAVGKDKIKPTGAKRAKSADLYSVSRFQKDCSKTYQSMSKLYQKYQDGATPKVANVRKVEKPVKPKPKAISKQKATVSNKAKAPTHFVQGSLF